MAQLQPNAEADDGIRLSTVVMHHPSRAAGARGVIDALGDPSARVVADPEPGGVRSPLRTAKRAWRSIAPGATHHLVLQDDVRLCDRFGEHLRAAVGARPDAVIALYVNADSPSNSYAVRHAAATGAPWAALIPGEFVPTLGLVMPARLARALAAFLDTLPDELRDDDAYVDLFCRLHDRPVVATVPNLVEHGAGRSVAGNDGHGVRRSAVFVSRWEPAPGMWSTAVSGTSRSWPMRSAGSAEPGYAVSVRAAHCVIRFIHASVDHPLRQPCAPWRQACGAVGVAARTVLEGLSGHLRSGDPSGADLARRGAEAGLGPEPLVEMWAAGFLLGADACAPPGGAGGPAVPAQVARRARRRAIDSWADAGFLNPVPPSHREEIRGLLVELGLAAVAAGQAHRRSVGHAAEREPLGVR
ncbi:hypothetical protein OHT52_12765 [Streptomyces sp. NBC_00247]|uniref:hypothetical protein n=1 Tax=Streptomyces sp. NBC_00247 TaxID=2975689 RepID=UPI002E2A950C|nr:hypothetical protein [Streptomyces sp. NBC_00247]